MRRFKTNTISGNAVSAFFQKTVQCSHPKNAILFVLALLLIPAFSNAQCACNSAQGTLGWTGGMWPAGSLQEDYDIIVAGADTVNVDISFQTDALGSFLNQFSHDWPKVDVEGGVPDYFGDYNDLAVIFNPAANQDTSPIFIEVLFSRPVSCLSFEISDIDISGAIRTDQVRVTSDAGDPTLTAVSTNPTFSISGNTATATGTGGANGSSASNNYGTVIVDFGDLLITSILITYNEVNPYFDPAARGMGFFGQFSLCPSPELDTVLGSIQGVILQDVDGDGTGDIAVPEGAVVELLDGAGNPVLDEFSNPITTVTDASGNYIFSDLPGGVYQVTEQDPTGFLSVSDTDGGDANNGTVAITSTNPDVVFDFTDVAVASISGTVWEDTDGDGFGDNPVPEGTVINLLDSNGDIVYDTSGNAITTTTSATGTYSFSNLFPQDYQVQEVDPADFSSVGDTDGSDANNTVVSLLPGENEVGIDFIDELSGTISGVVTIDTTNNDAGDIAMPVTTTIYLLDGLGDTVLDDNGDPFVTTTLPDGTFTFTDVPPGTYQVVEVDPFGYVSVNDSDGVDFNTVTVTVTSGENIENIEFADEKFGAISGTVMEDTTGDGTGDTPEPGLTVSLQNTDGTPVTDVNGNVLQTTTDENGFYSFNGVLPGSYQVVATDPAGYTSIEDTDGGDANITAVTLSGTEDITDIDFIDQLIFSISGNVFNDANGLTDDLVNGSGISTANGEQLYITVFEGTNIVDVIPVNPDGSYVVTGLMPGLYFVQINDPASSPSLPANWVNTGEVTGLIGSDASVNGRQRVRITDADIDNINFGIEQLPVAFSATESVQANPGGTAQVPVPTLGGLDAEDGAYGAGSEFIIETAPTNGTLYYNGVEIGASSVIENYDPAFLTVDPDEGFVTVAFTYTVVDAGGFAAAPATVTMPFDASLPITLIEFTVTKDDGNAVLRWVTANETNNHYFDVERSADGVEYVPLMKIRGAGTTNQLTNYNYTDEHVLHGDNYYRLKQVDNNHAHTYSSVRSVRFETGQGFEIYPNPVSGVLWVNPGRTDVHNIQLFSVDGRLVLDLPIAENEGTTKAFDISELGEGLYFIKANFENGDSVHKPVRILKN